MSTGGGGRRNTILNMKGLPASRSPRGKLPSASWLEKCGFIYTGGKEEEDTRRRKKEKRVFSESTSNSRSTKKRHPALLLGSEWERETNNNSGRKEGGTISTVNPPARTVKRRPYP